MNQIIAYLTLALACLIASPNLTQAQTIAVPAPQVRSSGVMVVEDEPALAFFANGLMRASATLLLRFQSRLFRRSWVRIIFGSKKLKRTREYNL